MAPQVRLLNRGIYSVPEAARLLQKSSRWVWNVIRGYETRRSARHTTSMPPVFGRDYLGSESDGYLSFLDLIELKFIRDFRGEGVSMQVIRRAAQNAREEFRGEAHPFCVKQFVTDGKTIFARSFGHDGPMVDMRDRQHVFRRVVDAFVKQLDYSKVGEIERWYPLGKEHEVVLDPRVNFGAPYIHKSGVPVATLVAARNAGDTPASIAHWFKLEPAQVRSALDFAKELRFAA